MPERMYYKGIVISANHLLSQFHISEHISCIAWTVNAMSRLIKNPKHISAITFLSKPDINSSESQAGTRDTNV